MSDSRSITITPNQNTVTVTNENGTIIVSDNNKLTTVSVTQPVTSVIEVATIGPQGATGTAGTSATIGGNDKSIQFNSGSQFAGSNNFTFNSSTNTVYITGSLIVSSSNTFRNIGNTILEGNVNVTGSVAATTFIGDGSTLSNLNFVSTSSFNTYTSSIQTQIGNIVANTSSLVTTSSFNQFTSSINQFASLTNQFTSSINQFTSSIVTTSSFNQFTSSIQTQVNSLSNVTSSYILASQTSSMSVLSSSYSVTASVANSIYNINESTTNLTLVQSSYGASGSLLLSPDNGSNYLAINGNATAYPGIFLTSDTILLPIIIDGASGVRIKARDAVTAIDNWEFRTDGTLRFPDDTVQTTAYTGITIESFATTGSNTFIGNQNVVGDLVITGSLLVSGSRLEVIGNQIMSGAVIFDGGSQITPTFYGYNNGGIDIVAGPSGFAELASNNSQSYVWVDDNGAFVVTSNQYQFEFRDDGYFVLPQVQSLTKQAGILSAGDIIIQADESQSWRFASGSGVLQAPGGIEATSFTGSLQGTATNALTASYSSNYLPLLGGTINGDVTITQNLVVQGTASLQHIQYISQSSLNIGSNLITVNTSPPTTRFGGLAVYDSGSGATGLTGSLLWDSQENVWIYSNPSGSTYDGGIVLMGPRNFNGLGNEVGIGLNYLAKGNGSHHVTSSQIIDNGTTVSIPGNLVVTGSIIGTVTTASYVLNAVSASYAATASYAINVLNIPSTPISRSFGIVIDGAGSAITTGIKTDVIIPFNMTISSWTLIADQVGSIVIDVWKDNYATFPPTVLDSIAGSEKPTLSSALKNQDTNLTTWTTSITAGDIVRFNVDSASTITKATLTINGIS